MIHHIDLGVTDFARSRDFYVRALAPLGLRLVIELERAEGAKLIGFGSLPDPVFWIREGRVTSGWLHVAFSADSRSAVDAFHEAALAAGGIDNGAPGLRRRYGEHWYSAYVLDPDGHNVEAVCRKGSSGP